ncbi:MAG: glycyl-radical enzyme activating protein [Pseudomonadales bacterium]|jgi:pyruvate formate lyase activating enzyme|nr:glycyl-radical enzyme activating protein [Pseudomonadales bacterium]|tara:strand:- start:2228 stop:3178 length:951 start_codon:yes stop_codon:yes gene_type:complete
MRLGSSRQAKTPGTNIKGIIFDIKKFAIHDGPGIRTTVFFKGCPLRCWWCHNPEAIQPGAELVWFENKCIKCGECIKACEEGAHELLADGTRVLHRDRCTLCGDCVEVCYAEALVMEGREVTVEEVMVELRKDIPFYENSGGGITLSGGEPTFQHEFALAILRQCHSEGLHTAIDTTGQTRWEIFERMLPYTDLVLYDLKQMNSTSHKQLTGVPNERILANLARISDSGVAIEIRMPIIPGINDDRDAIECAARYLTDVDTITRVVLLPFHKLGEAKYSRLDRDAYRLKELVPPEESRMQEIAEWVRHYDLDVSVG